LIGPRRSDQGYIFVVGGVETRRSYAELQQASFRVARSLSEAGLRPGDVVALVLGDAEPFLTALFRRVDGWSGARIGLSSCHVGRSGSVFRTDRRHPAGV